MSDTISHIHRILKFRSKNYLTASTVTSIDSVSLLHIPACHQTKATCGIQLLFTYRMRYYYTTHLAGLLYSPVDC